jgi:pimeloyl-ACP methyl ester carboxylesterase
MGKGRALPVPLLKSIKIPTLVMHGGAGSQQMRDAALAITKSIPHAQILTLAGQTHGVSPKSLSPVLTEFFSAG